MKVQPKLKQVMTGADLLDLDKDDIVILRDALELYSSVEKKKEGLDKPLMPGYTRFYPINVTRAENMGNVFKNLLDGQ